MPGGNDIPVGPQGPPPGSNPGGNPGSQSGGGTGGSTGGSSGGSSGGSGGGGGGGGGNPYLAAQRKQNAKAHNSYMQQAGYLNKQIRGLRKAINGGFLRALEIRLANVRGVQRQQDKMLREGYKERVSSLRGAHRDNEKDAADQSVANLSNRTRERANATSEAMLQGAGESDLLRSQAMSLRSWDANQGEINRSYFDTNRSINSSLTDLNIDTKNARSNVQIEANADIEQLYTGYYSQMSEALTALGNTLGQQATLYSQAGMYGGDGGKKRKKAEKQMGHAFNQSSHWISQAWENPGVRPKLMKWEGRGPFDSGQENSTYRQSSADIPAPARPEGATLRSWT